jgi:signal peptidase I
MPNELFADILQQELDLKIKVTGRSMRPFINNGDIVILRKVFPESLQYGDIIYYTSTNGSQIMHRIVAKTLLSDNSLLLTTKGDALLQKDMPISADQILGKAFYVEKNLPLLGPFSFNLDSILCSILNRIFALIFRIKCKTKNYLKLAFGTPVNK